MTDKLMKSPCKHWYGDSHKWQYKRHAWDTGWSDCFVAERCSVCGQERMRTFSRYEQKPYDVMCQSGRV